MVQRYSLEPSEISKAGLGEADTKLYIPVRDKNGKEVGYVLRKLDKSQAGPKSVLHIDEDCAILSWYPKGYGLDQKSKLVIVEDQLSAIRASTYMDAVALIGTNLSENKVADIIKAKKRRVIIALDKDATGKAAILVKKYRVLFDSVELLPLDKDLKDMSRDELEDLLGHETYG